MKLDYRPEIDGLRTIAVLSVIFYHTKVVIFDHEIFKGGFIGVDIFFVISGYLISLIILKELNKSATFSFKNFYERRIRRILPPLLVVMLIFSPLSWYYLLPINFVDYSKSILYSIGFSSNYFFWSSGFSYGDVNTSLKPFLHTWSLSVEEQFYILFPLVLLFIFRYLKKYLISILIFFFIISLLIADYGSKLIPNANFYFITSRGWELLSGSILAYFEIKLGHRSQQKKLNLILPSLGLILIIYSIIFFNDQMFHPSLYTLLPVIGICIIIWFSDKNEPITKLLSSKLFVYLGLISYSLYLWHYPILVFDTITEFSKDNMNKKILIGLAILVLSIISYHFIERPSRNRQNSFKKILSLVILFSLILVIINIIVIKNDGFKKRLPEIISSNSFEYNSNKFLDYKIKNSNNKTVFLIGDSQMETLRLDLKKRVQHNNYEFDESIVNECLFFPGFNRVIAKTGKMSQSCNINYYSELENKLKKEKNSILIFGGRFPLYIENSFFDNEEGGIEDKNLWRYRYISSRNFKSIQDSFRDSVYKLSKINQVILIYPIPEVGWHISQKFFNQLPKEIISTSYKVYKKRTKSSFELLDSIKGENIYRVYPNKIFCNTIIKDRCITHDEKNVFYLDHNHPSLEGAKMINDLILFKIKEIEKKKK
jgi:peptidoglycan/LPS O-acetylase OafA/YrhL